MAVEEEMGDKGKTGTRQGRRGSGGGRKLRNGRGGEGGGEEREVGRWKRYGRVGGGGRRDKMSIMEGSVERGGSGGVWGGL